MILHLIAWTGTLGIVVRALLALHADFVYLQTQRIAAKAEQHAYACVQLQAAARNISEGASIIKQALVDRESEVDERRDELLAAIADRESELECGQSNDALFEVYHQKNPDLPPDWPNWAVRPRHQA